MTSNSEKAAKTSEITSSQWKADYSHSTFFSHAQVGPECGWMFLTLAFTLLSYAELPAMCVMSGMYHFFKAEVALGVAFCVCVMSLMGLHQAAAAAGSQNCRWQDWKLESKAFGVCEISMIFLLMLLSVLVCIHLDISVAFECTFHHCVSFLLKFYDI